MKRLSDDKRIERGYGTGYGKDYKPWLLSGRFSSTGTASSFPDWKHGRMVELLSQAEVWWYVKLRWNDNVTDIREQFPLLPNTETNEIADSIGVKRPQNGKFTMTTDLLVDTVSGKRFAISVKVSREAITERDKQLMAIEKEYWNRRGVEFAVGLKEDLNPTEITNIMDCVDVYNPSYVRDEIGILRYLIAHKILVVDMERPLDYQTLLKNIKETDVWQTTTSMLAHC